MAKAKAKRKSQSADIAELKKQAGQITRKLKSLYPDAECALVHRNPYELLVATILSAQCTDERVNITTPALFRKYPTPAKLAASKQADVEKLIKSTGFFRAKATNIRAMAEKVDSVHNGAIPQDLESLVKLPGVGRKTANVLLGVCFGIPSGVVVDTHVKRISNLLGLTTSSNPEQIERDLMEILPKKQWIDYSHRIIHHGRKICIARRPKCTECGLLKFCSRVGLPPIHED